MIWLAGSCQQAVQACRAFCMDVPLCVTVTPTTYVYTGGAEEGVCVRLIHYPRFHESKEALVRKAEQLARHLRCALCQHSYTIEYPNETHWDTLREQA